jgi:hypothetical protein
LNVAYKGFADTPNVAAFIVHRLIDEGDNGKQYGVLQEDFACKPIYGDLAALRRASDRVVCPPPES